ncbi:RluA family pseudouridine synthase [Rhodoferax sp.]|uniref:RluA family pseudouridine synthase n=1 Tax=Rhodoferax sp. TaxID=50421 RepID=UPI0019EA62DB|nr:RluA family pseudouridine synthase [Rhodoferax sp.]MBE0473515.1 RluA family pseudouridine synthase [Rhodoferax sp.]
MTTFFHVNDLSAGCKLHVLHADNALLVLDKPAGLLSVPGKGADKQDCLSRRVQRRYADALVVHRLDQATSGLLVMARGASAQRVLSEAFASRQVHKRYVAVVDGLLEAPEDAWAEIDLPILLDWPDRPRRIIDPQGKPSRTRWRVLGHNLAEQTTRLELEPVTGRSHQLRVHLQAIQHPILGDALYGTPASLAKAERLLLHATRLELTHPVNQQTMVFSSEPPF